MVSSILRVIIIIFIISVTLVVIANLSLGFGISFSQFSSLFTAFLQVCFYIFPFGKLFPILAIVISITIFRSVIALIKTVWNILPIRG